MSQTPDTGLEGLTVLEAEAMDFALGAGSRAERKAAELRLLSDPAFRAAVERWQALLAPLDGETPDMAPPPAVWQAILADVQPAPRTAQTAAAPTGWWHNVGLWRGLGLGGTALAALAVALLVLPAAPVPQAPAATAPSLVATLADSEGRPLLAAAVDPASGEVRFAPVATPDGAAGKVPELWVIEGKNPPRSLGVIDISAGAAHAIPPARLTGLKAGAVLAISIEPIGGSPTGAPTGPVIATGALSAA
ncbi:anti-sigma factor [Sandarakinorhabdus rubra]|uniref:anti-sigma factor n=1 Tax=Sandarakinorhabdus rubra TaxID=2672568 RepID=UPI0013DD771B|nr:anti-sigma factor [Sandarakinorhabdus rubra]